MVSKINPKLKRRIAFVIIGAGLALALPNTLHGALAFMLLATGLVMLDK